MCPFYTDLVEIDKNCLWSCGFAMEIWKRIITLLIPIYPRAMYTCGAVLWTVVQDKLMVYEQEEVCICYCCETWFDEEISDTFESTNRD